MKKTVFKFFTVSLALLLAVSMMLPAVSALQFANGQEIGSGKATSVENKTLDTGYTYSKATYTDGDGDTQAVYALEFNPTSGNYMPIMYSKYTGTGAAALPTAQDAESKFGVNVVGGVNANFYSIATGSTYAGYWVHDGRLAQAESGLSSEIVAFMSDGTAEIVDSKLTFDVYFNGKLVTYNGSDSLAYINKKSVSSNVSNLFYYWDTECGNNTDSVIDGVEILCKKLDGGELGIERILNGEIIEIRTDSHYSPVGKDEFVLYVKNDSQLKEAIEGTYKVGDTISIKVNENIEASKEVTSAAVTAFAGQYKIIENGEYAPGSDTTSLDHYNQLAQRTSFGIKADGSIVLVCTAGRRTTDNAPGLTIPELGQIMLQLGCVTAYNFDGGGSTQMIYKENGEFQYGLKSNEGANGRNVANCLLIAERPSEFDFSGLDALIEAVDGVITTDEAVAAVAAAKAVKASDTAMEGDVIIASMKLQQILDAENELKEVLEMAAAFDFSDYAPAAIENIREAYTVASSLSDNADSSAIVSAAWTLKTALSNTGDMSVNVTSGKTYEMPLHYASSENYGDSGGELTDGQIAGISNAYGSPWVAFTSLKNPSGSMVIDDKSRRYYDIIVDLGEHIDNITQFNAFTEYFHGSGIDYCIAVDYAVSDNKINWTEAGRATANPAVQDKVNADLQYPLTIEEGVGGRYLRVRLIAATTTQFIFISELQAYADESTVPDILKDDASIDITADYVRNVELGTTVDEIKSQFNGTVTVTGAVKDVVGTGTILAFGGAEFEMVVMADISGDGVIAQTDYLLLKRHVVDSGALSGARLEAAKFDGKSAPDQISCLKLKRHIITGTGLF